MDKDKRKKRIVGGTTIEERTFNQTVKLQDAENIPELSISDDTNYFDDREDYLMSLY